MILVTGATGNIGRLVVELLLADGEKVEAVTRNPAAAALPGDAHVVSGDPSRPTTLTSLLEGVEAILISPRALGDATAGAATSELLAQAAEQSVERVVALSAATVAYPAGYARFAEAFKAVENAVKASGLQWTILRATTMHRMPWPGRRRSARPALCEAPTATRRPRRSTSATSRRWPSRALVNPTHAGHAYLLSGPESLSQRDKVRLIGEAIGAELSFEELPSRADPPGHARPGPTRGRPRPVARLAGRLRETAGAVIAHCGDGVGPPRAHLRRVGSRGMPRLPELRDGDTRGYRHCPPSPPMTTDNPLELII